MKAIAYFWKFISEERQLLSNEMYNSIVEKLSNLSRHYYLKEKRYELILDYLEKIKKNIGVVPAL